MCVRGCQFRSQLRSAGSCRGRVVSTSRGRHQWRAVTWRPGRSASWSRSLCLSPSAGMSLSLCVKRLRQTEAIYREISRFENIICFSDLVKTVSFWFYKLLGALCRKTCQKVWSCCYSNTQDSESKSLLLKYNNNNNKKWVMQFGFKLFNLYRSQEKTNCG